MVTEEQEMTFGRVIREAREARGWSQEYVARKLEVSVTTVRNWEKNEKEPRLSRVLRLAVLFDWPLSGLSDNWPTRMWLNDLSDPNLSLTLGAA